MPESKDPIVYRFVGAPGSGLSRIPGHHLRQSDIDAMDADQKKTLKDHVEADYLLDHVFKAVGVDAPAAAEKTPAAAKAADQKKGDG